jgi:hypothetical protein
MKAVVNMISVIILVSWLALGTHAWGQGSTKVPISKFTRVEEKVGNMTKHFKESIFRATDNGLFGVELMLFDGNLHSGRNDFDILIHDSRNSDVAGARVGVLAVSAEGSSSLTKKARQRAAGLYTVEGLILKHAGQWELSVAIAKDEKKDTVLFQFPDVQ